MKYARIWLNSRESRIRKEIWMLLSSFKVHFQVEKHMDNRTQRIKSKQMDNNKNLANKILMVKRAMIQMTTAETQNFKLFKELNV
jgi:hypothetical protein